MATFRSLYDLGDVVYIRIAEERRKGMVTGVKFTGMGHYYSVAWAGPIAETEHYDYELSAEFVPDYAKDAD